MVLKRAELGVVSWPGFDRLVRLLPPSLAFSASFSFVCIVARTTAADRCPRRTPTIIAASSPVARLSDVSSADLSLIPRGRKPPAGAGFAVMQPSAHFTCTFLRPRILHEHVPARLQRIQCRLTRSGHFHLRGPVGARRKELTRSVDLSRSRLRGGVSITSFMPIPHSRSSTPTAAVVKLSADIRSPACDESSRNLLPIVL